MKSLTRLRLLCVVVTVSFFATSCSKQDLKPTTTDYILDDPIQNNLKSAAEWNYSGQTGPDFWHLEFPNCGGQSQSPIDIGDGNAIMFDLCGDRLNLNYSSSYVVLQNNGHTINVFPQGVDNHLYFENKKYLLKQYHFHSDSEHSFSGMVTDMEIHFVHQNENDPNDLLVIGALIVEGDNNSEYEKLFNAINQVPVKGDEFLLDQSVSPLQLMPDNAHDEETYIFQYSGSLTTPPCSEIVRWNVFADFVELSASQISQFRAIYDHTNRPIQALNNRTVHQIGGDCDH